MSDLTIRISVKPQLLRRLFFLLLFIAVVLLLLTAIVHNIYAKPYPPKHFFYHPTVSFVLNHFNLSSENTLASWFSSMLLLITGLTTIICYWLDTDEREKKGFRFLIKGWLILAALFFGLSLDEMGSLHENAGNITFLDIAGDGSWESVLAIPGILIMLYMILFAWIYIRHSISTIVLITLGTLFFGSVPLQEHYEMQAWEAQGYSSEWKRPILHVILEEGAELAGSLCFFFAMVIYLRFKSRHYELYFSFLKRNIQFMMIWTTAGAFLLMLLFYTFSSYLNADEGKALNWFPSAASFLTMLFCFSLTDIPTHGITKIFLLLVSIYFGTNFYMLHKWNYIFLLLILFEGLLIAGLFFTLYTWRKKISERGWRIGIYGWGILILFSFLSMNPIVVPLAFFAFVLLANLYVYYAPGAHI